MASATAVRFVITGTVNVDFTGNEIRATDRVPRQLTKIFQADIQLPVMADLGDKWDYLFIDFVLSAGTTEAKIQQLEDDGAEMVCYYAYRDFTTTKALNVILDPQNVVEEYVFGGKRAGAVRRLTFIQSS